MTALVCVLLVWTVGIPLAVILTATALSHLGRRRTYDLREWDLAPQLRPSPRVRSTTAAGRLHVERRPCRPRSGVRSEL